MQKDYLFNQHILEANLANIKTMISEKEKKIFFFGFSEYCLAG